MDVGPLATILVVMLALLAVAAAIAVAVLVAAAALVATTLATLPIAYGIHRRRWRRWHPPTRWLPEDQPPPAPAPDLRHRAGDIAALAVVTSHGPGLDVHLLAVRTVPAAGDRPSVAGPTRTVVHARLAPGAHLELPGHAGFRILVYVLAGLGSVGTERLPVCTGQLALLDGNEPVRVTAGPQRTAAPLDVLVLGALPDDRRLPWTGPTVIPAGSLRRRLHALRATTHRRPAAVEPAPSTGPAPSRVLPVRSGAASCRARPPAPPTRGLGHREDAPTDGDRDRPVTVSVANGSHAVDGR